MQGVFIKQKSRKSKKGFCPFCPPGLLRKPVYLIIYTIAGSFLLLSTLILAGCGNDQASESKGGRPGDTDAADASNLSAAIPVQVTPERRDEIVGLGVKSIVAGTLATCMTGAVVGIII